MKNLESHVPDDDRYLCRAVVRAFQILELFPYADALRFHEIVSRSGLSQGVVFRMLRTLEHCGFVERIGQYRYRRRRSAAARLPEELRVSGQAR